MFGRPPRIPQPSIGTWPRKLPPWMPMRAAGAADATAQESKDLLRWLDDGNFVFLGYRGYDLADDDGLPVLAARPGPGLGLLRHREQSRPLRGSAMPGARGPALALTKAGIRSTVLRDAYLDEVSLLRFDMAGNPTGEVCFVGLFAPSAASRSVRRSRSSGTRWPRYWTASDSRPGPMPARNCWPPSSPIRVTSCSTWTRMNWPAMPAKSCASRNATAPGCSSGPIPMDASCPRWCSFPAAATARRSGSASSRNCGRPSTRKPSSSKFGSASPPWPACFSGYCCRPAGRPAVDASALELRIIAATRSWAEGLDEALQRQVPRWRRPARLSVLWAAGVPGQLPG